MIVNVHLSADRLENGKRLSRAHERAEQLKCAEQFLAENLETNDLGLLLGDFNAEERPSMTGEYVDSWTETHKDSEPGYTFDPVTNLVARYVAQLRGASTEPRRLDHIYISRENLWQPHDSSLVGTDPFDLEDGKWFASDHYGVLVSLKRIEALRSPPHSLLIEAQECLPTQIVEALSLSGTGLCGQVKVHILGSAALGTTDEASDVDVLCTSGTLSRADFFKQVTALLVPIVAQVEEVLDAAVPLLRFVAGDTEIEVQFARVPDHVMCNPVGRELASQVTSDATSLAAFLDVKALQRSVWAVGGGHAYGLFRDLSIRLKSWARQQNVFGTAFGFPGGFAWTLLAAFEVTQSVTTGYVDPKVELFQSFFNRFAAWAWPPEGLSLPHCSHNTGRQSADIRSSEAHGRQLPIFWCPGGLQARNALRSLTRSSANVLKKIIQQMSREGKDAGFWSNENFMMLKVESEQLEDFKIKAWLKKKALSLILEAERLAGPKHIIWPLPNLQKSIDGSTCLVFGSKTWLPSERDRTSLSLFLASLHLAALVKVTSCVLNSSETQRSLARF